MNCGKYLLILSSAVLPFAAHAAFYSWTGNGGKDAAGRYYYDDPLNWGGGSPAYVSNPTDPGLGLMNTVTITLTNDFVSTRHCYQAAGTHNTFDLNGHKLTLMGNARWNSKNAKVTVTNGTLHVASDLQIATTQGTSWDITNTWLFVDGPGAKVITQGNISMSYQSNVWCVVRNGGSLTGTLLLGTFASSTNAGGTFQITGAGSLFHSTGSKLGISTYAHNTDHRFIIEDGARLANVTEFYIGSGKRTSAVFDHADFTNAPIFYISGGVSNTLDFAGITFPAPLTQIYCWSGFGHRIAISDGSRIDFPGAFSPFHSSTYNSLFEVTGGSIFARTNDNTRTSTGEGSSCCGNTFRIAGTGSTFIYDGYVYVGNVDASATFLIEEGGQLVHSGRNSGTVYVSQTGTTNNSFVVRKKGLVKSNGLHLGTGARACDNYVFVSDGGVVSNSGVLALGYWQRDPASGSFMKTPGGTNTMVVTSGGRVVSLFGSVFGSGNTIAITNGTAQFTGSANFPTGTYSFSCPDAILDTVEAQAKSETPSGDTHIMIGGTNSLFVSTHANGSMDFHGNTDFSFGIPAEGYRQAPIQSSKDIVLANCGGLHVELEGDSAAHRNREVVLMQAAGNLTVDEASLTAFNSELPKAYRVAVRDGNKLVLKPINGTLITFQ